MKYPQLVSMPSALQDWLDEQLEARGIDAVVYTRYILSLLQRDTLDPPDDLLSLSPNKVKEVGRRGRKRGRSREEYWHVWDCEQLKRSAAVECLKSASDQKCGIEKLVDELCAKLKEIQSEGESSVQLELSETSAPNKHFSTPSPQDQAQKYYAAFPPLNSKFAESSKSLITLIPEAGVWSGKKILADSFGKNKSCSEVLKEHKSWAEENKENDGNSSWKEIGRETMKSRSQMKDDAPNLNKQKKQDCYGFAWNMAEERNNTCNDIVVGYGEETVFACNKQNTDTGLSEVTGCRRLYERQMDEPVDHMEEEDADSNTDDLAQLIAKFDHSIEALWNPDDPSGSSDNVSSDGTLECEQELPLDFQQLLSSPSEQFLTVELYNKRNASVFSSRNSFIQCGTNITSSIWSDKPSLDNSAEQEDYSMDYSFTEQASADIGLKNVLTGEEKTVGSKLHNREDGSNRNKEDSGNFKNEKNNETKSDLKWIGNDVTSFFTNHHTLNLVSETNATQKWSEESPVGNYSQDVDEHAVQLFTSKVGIYNSLNTLNHNREGSSFTEVIPKQKSHTRSRAKPNESNVNRTRDDPNEMVDVEKEEEDLLTSTRTHFRPIRNDSLDSQNGSNTVGYYADGTTFVIPTSLDEVAFRRSESGALYLEADAGLETPKKYMEYKEKESYGGRHCYNDVYDSTREFVPKFRVRQNEKCCQTEEAEEQSASDEEVDIKRSRQDTKAVSESEDFFFPDDKQFADKMEDKNELPLNNNSVCTSCHLLHKQQCNFTGLGNIGAGIESSYGNVMQQTKHFCIKCDEHLMPHSCKFGWLKSPSNTAENVWQSDKEDHLLDSWYTIWKSNPGETSGDICTSCGEVQLMTDSKSLLREELTKDGEQLLSDLSYMQHLYQGSDWQDDSVPGGEIEWNKSPQEELLYGEDSSAAGKELQSRQGFESSSPVNVLKKEMWLSTDLESKWSRNERPFTVKCLQKDRKRRHSASHRWPCSCRLSHGVPCRFWAGASCLKGMACSSQTLRPVTL